MDYHNHSSPSSSSCAGFFPTSSSSSSPPIENKPPIIDLHTHSTCSDGMLSPLRLVEKAASRGVQVLALTDHDTMEGVPEALEAANKLGIRLIPGVEISAIVGSWKENGYGEPVHILGYYSGCGPAKYEQLEKVLSGIREARVRRAESIVRKLTSLGKPITWGRVVAMAGVGVAPGRVHIARALLEAGHVDTFREAFNKYLYDGGPAYEQGFALSAEDAVSLVIETGGISCLAHPWSLKDPLSLVKRLKLVGLHAMEVYRADKKPNGFSTLAETYDLLKLGGSDYHGRGDPDEVKLGKVSLPSQSIYKFFAFAQPIWMSAIKDLIRAFNEETFTIDRSSLEAMPTIGGLKHFTRCQTLKGDIALEYLVEEGKEFALLKVSSWLNDDEMRSVREAIDELNLTCEMKIEDEKVVFSIRREII